MKRWLVFALMFLVMYSAAAAPPASLAVPPAALEQRLGAQLPLEMSLVDTQGRAVRLGDYFQDGRPVLLVLGYYRCPQLCGLLMHGLLEGLQEGAVPRRDVRIVGVSIDPADTPATARARRDLDLAYADFLLGSREPDAPLELHLLTAPAADIDRLARSVGFTYEPLGTADQAGGAEVARYAHPAVAMVATARGRISHYLMGIRFDPGELRLAVAQASSGGIGSVSDRIALLCAHFDPRWGRLSAAVMNGLRVSGLLFAAALALWCWRRRGPSTGGWR